MQYRNLFKVVSLALVGFLGASATPVRAITQTDVLSGAVEFGATSNGTDVNDAWNTVGGDASYNLYLAQGATNGSLINSGDGLPTSISVALSPGTYSYSLFGDGPDNPEPDYGLSLFFDGNSSAPSISVFAPVTTGATPPSFAADAQATAYLGPYTFSTVTTVPGAGKTSFTDGTELITLTSYSWANQSVNGLDRVSGFGSSSDGIVDFVGQFTLQVSAVPEPASIGLLALGAMLAIRPRR